MNPNIKKRKSQKASAIKDDFFELHREQTSTPWKLHFLAGILCIAFAMWVWMLNPVQQIYEDQINIVTMVFSEELPDNFARDPIWSNRVFQHYPSLARKTISFLIKRFGITGAHRVFQIPLSIAYLFAMYGTLYYLTRSVPAALVVSLFSMMWRWSLGATYWGLDRLQAVQPRSMAIIFIPTLFILIWKFRNSWWLLILFFITGLLFNINPPSAFYFAVLSWLSLFLFSLNDKNRILSVILAGLAIMLGALPFICINIAVRKQGAIDFSSQMLNEYILALQYRLRFMNLPLSADKWSRAIMFGFSFPLILSTIAWCIRGNKRNRFDYFLLIFFLFSFVGTVFAQYIMQKTYAHYKISPFLPNCMRGQKFAYLVLYIYITWLFAELLRRFALRDRCILILVSFVIVAIIPLLGNNKDSPWKKWRYNNIELKALLQGQKIEIAGDHHYISDVCSWARKKTSKDSLFLFVHRNMSPFRIYARRSMVCSESSGDAARFSSKKLFLFWYKYQKAVNWIVAKNDAPSLLKLADETKADYIIVPSSFPDIGRWDVVMRDRFWRIHKKL